MAKRKSKSTVRVRSRPPLRETNDTTLVRLVRGHLLSDIEHDFQPKLRLPPISQIANELGVSVGTANQAVKDLVELGILISRPRLGTTLAPGCTLQDVQKAHKIVTGDRNDKSTDRKTIQVMVNPEADEMFVEIAESFARQVTQGGDHVLFTPYPKRKREWHKEAEGDATVMFQPPATHKEMIHWPIDHPLVIVATVELYVDKTDGYDILTVDEEQGGFAAGHYARERGFTDACFIGRRFSKDSKGRYTPFCSRRLAGFERGFGKPITKENQLYIKSHDIDHGSQVVADFVLLDPRPQLVFCSADDPAIGFLIGAHAYGLRCGEHYHLMGFDRQEAAMNVPGGPITSVEVPRQQFGTRATELAKSRIDDYDQPVRRVFLGCNVFEGKTVGKVGRKDKSHAKS